MHRWDVENAVDDIHPLDAALAIDGIDEIAHEFGPKSDHPAFKGVSERFDGNGETFAFEATDIAAGRTFTMRPDRVDVDDLAADNADVIARGTASNLLLFLWGRLPADRLEVFGDRTLIDRYRELVPPG